MPRNANPPLVTMRSNAADRDAGGDTEREARLAGVAGKVARRIAKWGWLDVYESTRRGEPVRPFHAGMMTATLRRLGNKPKPPQEEDTHE